MLKKYLNELENVFDISNRQDRTLFYDENFIKNTSKIEYHTMIMRTVYEFLLPFLFVLSKSFVLFKDKERSMQPFAILCSYLNQHKIAQARETSR